MGAGRPDRAHRRGPSRSVRAAGIRPLAGRPAADRGPRHARLANAGPTIHGRPDPASRPPRNRRDGRGACRLSHGERWGSCRDVQHACQGRGAPGPAGRHRSLCRVRDARGPSQAVRDPGGRGGRHVRGRLGAGRICHPAARRLRHRGGASPDQPVRRLSGSDRRDAGSRPTTSAPSSWSPSR